jgi:hypothetical protein
MPANTSPLFGLVAQAPVAQVTTANTATDGTGTLVTLLTAGANATRVDRIYAVATGSTAAGLLRFFVYDGSNNRLVRELAVTAVTPSSTAVAWSGEIVRTDGYPLWVLPANYVLKVVTTVTQTINVQAFGSDF